MFSNAIDYYIWYYLLTFVSIWRIMIVKLRYVFTKFTFCKWSHFTKVIYNWISCMASPTMTVRFDRCGVYGIRCESGAATRCCICRSLYSWSNPVTGETWEGGIQTQESFSPMHEPEDRPWSRLKGVLYLFTQFLGSFHAVFMHTLYLLRILEVERWTEEGVNIGHISVSLMWFFLFIFKLQCS